MISALKTSYGKQVVFIVADVDSAEGTTLAAQYHVNAVPTIIFFNRDGSQAGRFEGWPGQKTVEVKIRSLY